MIKAQELRIGNLINNGFKTVEVVGLDKEGIVLQMYQTAMYADGYHPLGPMRAEWFLLYLRYEEAYPISLTEEWLERMGFEAAYDGRNLCKGHLGISIAGGKFQPLFHSRDEWEPAGGRLDYVHQLQNLFFALCGQELTIKP